MTLEEKLNQVSQVFSPTAPIEQKDLFFGRIDQLRKVYQAINERGQHVVIFGDRGVGKTSLANIASKVFPEVITCKVTCNRTESFKSIWEKALKKVRFISSKQGLGFNAQPSQQVIQLNLFLPDVEVIDSTDIENVFENLNNKLLFIFDEFDSISDEETKVRMADTIKALSDNVTNVTILIIGIAENVTDLIGSHPSLERCLLQIKMPRMSDDELMEIIVKGFERLGLSTQNQIKRKIIEYSSGFPNYTHLLCKFSAISAIKQDNKTVNQSHFSFAVTQSIENADFSIRNAYQKATISAKGQTQFEQVITACALATADEYNSFSANEMLAKLNLITKGSIKKQSIQYHLDTLCKDDRGGILEKIGISNNKRYKFKNPMMKAYVRLKIHEKNKKSVEDGLDFSSPIT